MLAYQHERYVADALEGILRQRTDFAFEVLVGDDASTDATRAVIRRYADANPGRIQTYFPDRNLGSGGKLIFDALLRRSRGEYIALLDGDDYWTSDEKLRRQVAYLDEHAEHSLCFHNVILRYEDGDVPDAPDSDQTGGAELDSGAILERCPGTSCGVMFRREAIDPLPGWFFDLPWGDWALFLMAAWHGRIWYMPDIMGVYRIHSGGLYRGLAEVDALRTLKDFYERLEGIVPAEFEERRRRALSKTWVDLGLEHERLGERAAARDCLRESLRLQPFRRPSRYLPPHWGTGERRRIALWLRLKRPTALVRSRG
jgi:glycosyltransferase involved in cell wall biosynthesis